MSAERTCSLRIHSFLFFYTYEKKNMLCKYIYKHYHIKIVCMYKQSIFLIKIFELQKKSIKHIEMMETQVSVTTKASSILQTSH